MAVTVKDFKIKAGLIVEGTTGTINNFDILTKKQADQDYIISLVGGSGTPDNTPDTLVMRDENGDFSAGTVTLNRVTFGDAGFIADDDGDLVLDTTVTGDDVIINADDIRLNAIDDVILSAGDQGSVDGDVVLTTSGGNIRLDAEYVYVGSNEVDSERVATRGYVDQAETDAVSSANSHTDTALLDYTTTANLDAHIDSHLSGGDGISYSAGVISADVANGLEITDGHIVVDRDTVDTWYDANGAASTAETNAINHTNTALEDYTPTASLDATIDGYGYLKSADLSDYATETYVNTAVANLVDGAPALLDTLNEIAAAIGDDENFSVTVANLVAEKQDTLTAGANIDITGDTISVTGLDTDDVAEGSNQYFTAFRAETAISNALGESLQYASEGAGNVFGINPTYLANEITDGARSAISVEQGGSPLTYNSGTGVIGIGIASQGGVNLDGSNDLQVNRDVVDEWYDAAGAAATAEQNAKDYADALDTDDVAEGAMNQYFTDSRAKDSAADLLTNATLTNITITGTGAGLTITAEGGVADATTDDLDEGSENLYFTDERAIDAVSNADIYPNAVIIDNVAKQVASQLVAATAGVQVGHAWAKADYRSAEFLVKVAYGTHTEISKVLVTLDTADNIAITEYGIVGTNGSASSISAGISDTDVQLLVTTTNNNSTVTVVGTLLV